MVVSLGFCFGVGFLVAGQPLSLGAVLLCSSLAIGGVVGCFSSGWLGFLVIIVYVGGMLVMFSYVCCLASNCLFGWSYGGFAVALVFPGCVWLSAAFSGVFGGFNYSSLSSSGVFECGSAMFSNVYFCAIVGLGCVLLLVMIAAVKLCRLDGGPLRPFGG